MMIYKIIIAKRQNNGNIEYKIQDYVIKSGYIKSGSPYILTDSYIRNDIKVNDVYRTLLGNKNVTGDFTIVKVYGFDDKALTTNKTKSDEDNILKLPKF